MNWRNWPRRTLPYLIAAAAGFLLAYLIVAFFVFPAGLVPTELRVPNIIGLSLEEAQTQLGRVGFKGKVGEERFNATTPKGTVLQQTPPAGSVEAEGTVVLMDISRGPRSGDVPSMVGMTRDEARVAIENAGFEVGAISERASEEPRGEVIGTSPAAGQRLNMPAVIDLIVSAGPSTLEVPELIGRSLPEARRMLDQVGLRLGRVETDSMAIDLPGTVTAQEPRAGRTISSNGQVSVTVAGRAP